MDKIINELKNNIRNSEIELLIENLISLNLSDKLENDFTLISSRYNRVIRRERLGLLNNDEYFRKLNQIVSAFLNLINQIYKTEIVNEEDILLPFERSNKISIAAEKLIEENKYSLIRQKTVLSSFSIPNRIITDKIWTDRNSELKSKEYLTRQYNERRSLEKHVTNCYCKLMIKPSIYDKLAIKRGEKGIYYRLKILLEFILNNKEKVDIIMNESIYRNNITIIGNWFFYKFQNHAKRKKDVEIDSWDELKVEKEILDFDNEFDELLRTQNEDIFEAKERTIKFLKDTVFELKKKL